MEAPLPGPDLISESASASFVLPGVGGGGFIVETAAPSATATLAEVVPPVIESINAGSAGIFEYEDVWSRRFRGLRRG